MDETPQTPIEAPTPPALEVITLRDIALATTIIAAACERGAIKATEMAPVGALYNKLVNFVNSSTKKPEDNSASKEQ